ncbi:Oidioi.mRNA.OKI2018_I69.chr1.g2607.t1.cds [Oikopleura dioica]|uniref:Oidioi.mRNA.OKI2018_I69.chr1.g2607.t1.cds n=1 Tax=Oikopleura dioica TaxID=34765 RepID=A0ABN7SS79_OIKDI|nr:Oidioi.mRNA.OKI2018_I69.chr1.g2607.t1.cds [Oikopleura dioica]
MSQRIDYWTNENGHRLRWREWPVDRPKAVVFISHTYGLHSGVFQDCALEINKHNIGVYAHDHMYHGESEPATPCSPNRCQFHCFDDPVRDIAERLRMLRHENPKIPVFIWGHGIGAVFAIRVAVEHENHTDGLILESPFINPSETAIGWHKTIGAQFLSYLVPDLKIPVIEPSFYTSEQKTLSKLLADPLCSLSLGMSTNLITLLSKELKKLEATIALLEIPFCAFLGEKDQIISLFSASRIEKMSPAKDKKIISYPPGKHCLHLEQATIRSSFIIDIIKWIEARSPAEAPPLPPKERKSRQKKAPRHSSSNRSHHR